jgi:hypothetical protein
VTAEGQTRAKLKNHYPGHAENGEGNEIFVGIIVAPQLWSLIHGGLRLQSHYSR